MTVSDYNKEKSCHINLKLLHNQNERGRGPVNWNCVITSYSIHYTKLSDEGVKCICLGDIHQVDNPYLNMENNGLNWVVNKFRGNRIYAHLVLKGERSRGPITDLVIRSGL